MKEPRNTLANAAMPATLPSLHGDTAPPNQTARRDAYEVAVYRAKRMKAAAQPARSPIAGGQLALLFLREKGN